MPLVDRVASGLVTGAPPILLVVGMYFGWTGNLLQWRDLLILALSYAVSSLPPSSAIIGLAASGYLVSTLLARMRPARS